MVVKSQKHVFSKNDIDEIIKLGYAISGSNTTSLDLFMQQKFPNFNLLRLLQTLEKYFTATTNKAINRFINLDNERNFLRIEYYNQYTNEDDALMFIREFCIVNKAIEIEHQYCIIPKSSRDKGLIKPVFQESLRQYINMNARRIKVHAGLSSGGYTWARHGFVATSKAEVEVILKKARELLYRNEFSVVQKIYDAYYSKEPKGKSFPIELWAALDYMKAVLTGSAWHGQIDLKNKEQFDNFKNYVFR